MRLVFSPLTRSTLRSWPRYNCNRTPHAARALPLRHTTTRLPIISTRHYADEPRPSEPSANEKGPDENIKSLERGPEPPPPRPFLSYTTAAITALVSSSFLAYRLFYYSPSSDDEPLNLATFVSRKLSLKQRISHNLSIFNLSSGRGDGGDDLWTQGVWSVEVKQPQLQIARAYTPLPPVKMMEESEGAWMNRSKNLRFLIRQEPMGEVSGYIHGLSEGAKVEVRGPHPVVVLPSDVREVVFLAGGTGIAPALQVAYALSRRAATGATSPSRPVRMSILWSSRTRDDMGDNTGAEVGSFQDRYASMTGQLQAIEGASRSSEGFRLSTRCFIDEEKTFLDVKDIGSSLASSGGPDGHRLILVSGPDGFVSHVAGPKVLHNGVEAQGPLKGLLSRLNLAGWQVWKL